MKALSLLIAILAATAITPAEARSPQVGDTITLRSQALACFDLENVKQLERTRAVNGLSAAEQFVDSHPLPDNPASAANMFNNACSRLGPGGTMYRVQKTYDWTSGGSTLFCIDQASKWDVSPGEKRETAPDSCWWVRLDE